MVPRLVRPRTERMIAGVCGGLGLYFGIDPVIMRLLFVVLTVVTNGLTLIAYPVLWLIMPEAQDGQPLPPGARFDPQTGQPLHTETGVGGQTTPLEDPLGAQPAPAGPRSRLLAIILVSIGSLVLLDNLGGIFGGFKLSSVAIPLVLVGLGVYLLRGART